MFIIWSVSHLCGFGVMCCNRFSGSTFCWCMMVACESFFGFVEFWIVVDILLKVVCLLPFNVYLFFAYVNFYIICNSHLGLPHVDIHVFLETKLKMMINIKEIWLLKESMYKPNNMLRSIFL